MNITADSTAITTFADLPVGALFFNYYGGDCAVKTSDTDYAQLHSQRTTLYTKPYPRVTDRVKPYGEGRPDHSGMLDLSKHKLVPLASIAKGTLLGHVTVDDSAKIERQSFEVAAWFRDHKLTPGTYPVYSGGLGDYGVPIYYAEIPSTITAACLVSLFGGVSYGPDTAGQREVGTASSRTMGNGRFDIYEDRAPFEGKDGFTFTPLENA